VNPIYSQSQTSVQLSWPWWHWFMHWAASGFTRFAFYRIAIGLAALVWMMPG
jgi:hypothetical protein